MVAELATGVSLDSASASLALPEVDATSLALLEIEVDPVCECNSM